MPDPLCVRVRTGVRAKLVGVNSTLSLGFPTRRPHMFPRCLISVCFAALCGCGQSEPVDPVEATEPVATMEEASSLSAAAAEPATEPMSEAEFLTADEPTTEEVLVEDYQPPFPDRVNLFLAPEREGKSTASNQEEAVELLGFVNVRNNRKAVLSINGIVYPVAEGDSQFGVEVISIQPPGVVLQRGRQRWQASLEN